MKTQKKIIPIAFVSICAVLLSACAGGGNKGSASTSDNAPNTLYESIFSKGSGVDCGAGTVSKKTQIKMTKDMFYKDGKFDQDAAKAAYFQMMENLGYPISDNLRKNMWVTDFNLGDFPNVGMAGIFWAHDNQHGVFGHEIFLLPNQMLIEHAHIAQDGLPAKNECWHARAGKTYCFGEEGEDASKYPDVKVPESQKKFVSVGKVSVADSKAGNVVWLNRIGAFHFQIAGPEGAVVTEYGAYHNTPGNRYTNPKVGF